MKEVSLIGIDLAKNIFHACLVDDRGAELEVKKFNRDRLIKFLRNFPKCTVAMEACGTSHHWGRTIAAFGHEVRLIPTQHVKRYLVGSKNDWNDARAIVKASREWGMRFVSVKTVYQQEVQALHRIRERLVRSKVSLALELRAYLAEFGVISGTGYAKLKIAAQKFVEDENTSVSYRLKDAVYEMLQELEKLEELIKNKDESLGSIANESECCKRLMKIPGVGLITATAIWAHVGDVSVFKNGRAFSAYFGLVPRQNSSGGKQKLGRITKRGDEYIRRMLIHGARSVVRFADKRLTKLGAWIMRVEKKQGRNKAVVALANKNARVIWALMKSGQSYKESLPIEELEQSKVENQAA